MVSPDPGFYREVLDQVTDGVYLVDKDRHVLYWNESAFRLTGYTASEMVGRSCQDELLCHVEYDSANDCLNTCPLLECIAHGVKREIRVFLRHKDGHRVPVLARMRPVLGPDGAIVGAIEIFSDDTAHTDAQRLTDEMRRMAFLDHLTQLPNRRFMEMSLQTALSEYQVHQNPVGVLYIDLDHFKRINDHFGHSVGDRVLQEVAKSLAGGLRPTDVVGRWGGDEFMAIVKGVNLELLKALADRCALMASSISIPAENEAKIKPTVSVGATMFRLGELAEQLVQRADELMYRSKSGGRKRITVG
jgi:diguanylate cyclase (GGDEF)-like protein/PAS domain S-box-containing protein